MDGGIKLFPETLPVQNFSIKCGNTDFGQLYTALSLVFIHCKLSLDVLEKALDCYS